MSDDKFLDKAYALDGPEATRTLYDAWSSSYDAEVAEHGYATPDRAAQALAGVSGDLTAPILDYGCGTGLSGDALRRAGFTTIDGADPSPEMLARANAKGLYRQLTLLDLTQPLPFRSGDYATIAAIGVIGAGAAPLEVFDTLVNLLGPGGKLTFSFNDHTLQDPACQARVDAAVKDGYVRLLVQDYGPHLPGADLNSMIYVLETV